MPDEFGERFLCFAWRNPVVRVAQPLQPEAVAVPFDDRHDLAVVVELGVEHRIDERDRQVCRTKLARQLTTDFADRCPDFANDLHHAGLPLVRRCQLQQLARRPRLFPLEGAGLRPASQSLRDGCPGFRRRLARRARVARIEHGRDVLRVVQVALSGGLDEFIAHPVHRLANRAGDGC